MNIYFVKFSSKCPVNGHTISYWLKISSYALILAEEIEDAVDVGPSFHESLADDFYKKFGGQQTLTARHGRVKIKTVRGK